MGAAHGPVAGGTGLAGTVTTEIKREGAKKKRVVKCARNAVSRWSGLIVGTQRVEVTGRRIARRAGRKDHPKNLQGSLIP